MARIHHSPNPVIVPSPGTGWAEKMVLNPAIMKCGDQKNMLMLFRASGPYHEKRLPGKPPPYPIFLGFAESIDGGVTWEPDFSRPALAPALETAIDDIYIGGTKSVNYANGCIEDPRLFEIEGQIYMTAACRMFPPGPYWEQNDITTYCPDWTKDPDQPFGRAARENLTVSVLYRINIDNLLNRDYDNSFDYITHLTDPELGDNRDVYLFPERLEIDGSDQYLCLHRPLEPHLYKGDDMPDAPSIFICTSERLTGIPEGTRKSSFLAKSLFEWEKEKIGGSWPPIKIDSDEWFMGYHGKEDDIRGYSQSFMILKKDNRGMPIVANRCSERLLYPELGWELSGSMYKTPCLFTTAGIRTEDDTLIMSYGAADEKIGIATTNLSELVRYIRRFGPNGEKR